MSEFGITGQTTGTQVNGNNGNNSNPVKKDYSKEIQDAIRQKISNHSVTSYQDLDRVVKSSVSLFGSDIKTDEQKNKAYHDYAEGLLLQFYDTNHDGKVSVDEFKGVETKSTRQEQKVTLDAQKETIASAKSNLEMLPGLIQQARQEGNEAKAKELESLQKELEQCLKEYEELEKMDPEKASEMFAQSLDINGNGTIETEELAFFMKTADGMNDNYTYDGKIKDFAERTLTQSFTGENASPEFIAKYGDVIKKYKQGETLTPEETTLLHEAQDKLRNGMQNASGIK